MQMKIRGSEAEAEVVDTSEQEPLGESLEIQRIARRVGQRAGVGRPLKRQLRANRDGHP
jgi:hypothetical protein